MKTTPLQSSSSITEHFRLKTTPPPQSPKTPGLRIHIFLLTPYTLQVEDYASSSSLHDNYLTEEELDISPEEFQVLEQENDDMFNELTALSAEVGHLSCFKGAGGPRSIFYSFIVSDRVECRLSETFLD